MTEQTDTPIDPDTETGPTFETPPKSGRVARIIFVLVAILIAALIVKKDRKLDPPSREWIDDDLPAALTLAKTENRPVLVLFVESPPSKSDSQLRNTTLRKPSNAEAIREHKLVPVMVRLTKRNRDAFFETYSMERNNLPILMVLDPQGKEIARHEQQQGTNRIGELEFRDNFLKDALK
jgi:DNA-directed RNA polymerase subunit H (RpoH/RPB5)